MPALTPGLSLEARQLAATRGARRLFADLSFRLGAGEVLYVRGPNGAGKTTLLRILAGLGHATAGQVVLDGAVVAPYAAALRGRLAFLGHAPALKDELTAEENLRTLMTLAGADGDGEAVRSTLARAGLERQRALPARSLSQGQRRRVGLARLAAVERPLWILDEPATALDAEGTAWLAELLTRHAAQGGIGVIATHQDLPLPNTRCATLTLSPG